MFAGSCGGGGATSHLIHIQMVVPPSAPKVQFGSVQDTFSWTSNWTSEFSSAKVWTKP